MKNNTILFIFYCIMIKHKHSIYEVGSKVCIKAHDNSYLYPAFIIKTNLGNDQLLKIYIKNVPIKIYTNFAEGTRIHCRARSALVKAKLMKNIEGSAKQPLHSVFYDSHCYDFRDDPIFYNVSELNYSTILFREWTFERFIKIVCNYNDYGLSNFSTGITPIDVVINYRLSF